MRASWRLFLLAGLAASCEAIPGEREPLTRGDSTPNQHGRDLIGDPIDALIHPLIRAGDRVLFASDKADLSAEARLTLERQVVVLRRWPQIRLTIEGHCDEVGTRDHNVVLGWRRADAVRDYLVALGIAPDRLRTISYGSERPVVLGSNERAWKQNRRAVSVPDG